MNTTNHFTPNQTNLVLGVQTPDLEDGIHTWDTFVKACEGKALGFISRFYMEQSEDWMHFIPYIAFRHTDPDTGERRVYVYQRTNKVGEAKLGGNYSIGIGGHVELNSCIEDSQVSSKAYLDIESSLTMAAKTEISEEIKFDSDDQIIQRDWPEAGELITQTHDISGAMVFFGRADMSNNNVGKFHIGLFFVIDTTSENLQVAEEELLHVGFKNKAQFDELVATGKVEGWSQTLAEIAFSA